MTQEALKLALEELAVRFSEGWHEGIKIDASDIMLLNEAAQAMAQPEQEPVKMVAYNCTCGRTMKFESVHGVVAPQRTWVGLEGEEIRNLWEEATKPDRSTMTMVTSFARAIESKLKEFNK